MGYYRIPASVSEPLEMVVNPQASLHSPGQRIARLPWNRQLAPQAHISHAGWQGKPTGNLLAPHVAGLGGAVEGASQDQLTGN